MLGQLGDRSWRREDLERQRWSTGLVGAGRLWIRKPFSSKLPAAFHFGASKAFLLYRGIFLPFSGRVPHGQIGNAERKRGGGCTVGIWREWPRQINEETGLQFEIWTEDSGTPNSVQKISGH